MCPRCMQGINRDIITTRAKHDGMRIVELLHAFLLMLKIPYLLLFY